MRFLKTYILISKAQKSVPFYSMINHKIYKKPLLKRVSSNWIQPNFNFKTTKSVSVIATNTIMMAVGVLVSLISIPNSTFTHSFNPILPIGLYLFSTNQILKLKWDSMLFVQELGKKSFLMSIQTLKNNLIRFYILATLILCTIKLLKSFYQELKETIKWQCSLKQNLFQLTCIVSLLETIRNWSAKNYTT